MEKVVISISDEQERKIITDILEDQNLAYVLSSSGENILSLLEDNKESQLLIIENEIQDIEGRELIRKVRNLEDHKDIPIIIASAPIQFDEAQELLDLGASYFIPKPITEERIKYYINRIVSGQ